MADKKNEFYEEEYKKWYNIGFEEGFKIGLEIGMKKTVRKMITKGYDKEKIMDLLDLTVEEIELIIEEGRKELFAGGLNETPDSIIANLSRLKFIIDKEALLADAKNKGRKIVVRKMIDKGYDKEKIMDLLALTIDEVETFISERE